MKRPALIACIVAVVVLSTGIAMLFLWPDSRNEPEQMITPPPSVATTVDLIHVANDEIEGIFFMPNEGAAYAIRIDNASGEIVLETEDLIFEGQPIALFAVMTNASTLTNLTLVTDEADDEQLSMFGFDEPAMTIVYIFTNGSVFELQVGAIQAAGQSRYARVKDSREVVLFNEMQSALLALPVEDLFDTTFFPHWDYMDVESAVADIGHVIIESERGIMEIRKRVTAEDFEGTPIGSSVYHFLQPHKADANDTLVPGRILEDLVTIFPGSIVSVRPVDLSAYGLDTPVRLTVSTIIGNWSGTLLIGNHSSEKEGRYVMIEGHDAVLLDQNGNYDFLDVRFSQLRSIVIWRVFIDEVSSVTFDLDGVIRVLTLDHGNGDEPMRAQLDDEEISENTARDLFTAALMITMSGETDAHLTRGDTPVYSITMHKRYEADETIDLYRINDSQFLIVYNGENTGLFITRMSLQENLLSMFE